MPKITPFLWFNGQAEEAAKFYTSVFKGAKLGNVVRYAEAGPMPAGTALTASFEIDGLHFIALNGGPHFKFNEAVSFQIDCASQDDVDYYWEKLTADGGSAGQCGWLKDKFGLSWQVVPSALSRLLSGGDNNKATRVMAALMQMKKLDIATLQKAYDG